MDIFELLLIAVGLSMDAFAVSVCKGLSVRQLRPRHYLITGAWFGGFQALMPSIGYILGSAFDHYINAFDHWIAFVLLAFIGGNMVKESFSGDGECRDGSFGLRTMFLLAVATSIDALAVGITFAFLRVPILPAACLIGCTTFCLSLLGVWVGYRFGSRWREKATLAGGVILILIGLKILLEHTGIL